LYFRPSDTSGLVAPGCPRERMVAEALASRRSGSAPDPSRDRSRCLLHDTSSSTSIGLCADARWSEIVLPALARCGGCRDLDRRNLRRGRPALSARWLWSTGNQATVHRTFSSKQRCGSGAKCHLRSGASPRSSRCARRSIRAPSTSAGSPWRNARATALSSASSAACSEAGFGTGMRLVIDDFRLLPLGRSSANCASPSRTAPFLAGTTGASRGRGRGQHSRVYALRSTRRRAHIPVVCAISARCRRSRRSVREAGVFGGQLVEPRARRPLASHRPPYSAQYRRRSRPGGS